MFVEFRLCGRAKGRKALPHSPRPCAGPLRLGASELLAAASQRPLAACPSGTGCPWFVAGLLCTATQFGQVHNEELRVARAAGHILESQMGLLLLVGDLFKPAVFPLFMGEISSPPGGVETLFKGGCSFQSKRQTLPQSLLSSATTRATPVASCPPAAKGTRCGLFAESRQELLSMLEPLSP